MHQMSMRLQGDWRERLRSVTAAQKRRTRYDEHDEAFDALIEAAAARRLMQATGGLLTFDGDQVIETAQAVRRRGGKQPDHSEGDGDGSFSQADRPGRWEQ